MLDVRNDTRFLTIGRNSVSMSEVGYPMFEYRIVTRQHANIHLKPTRLLPSACSPKPKHTK